MSAQDDDAIDEWALRWDKGSLVVQSLGAMLSPRFDLADGRSVAPFATAPWCSEPPLPSLPGVLRRMRGEWPCIPYGLAEPRHRISPTWRDWCYVEPEGPLHGPCANGRWSLVDRGADRLTLRFHYPPDDAIAWVEREIRVRMGAAAVECRLSIMPRRDAALPIAIHPVLRLPDRPRGLRLRVGAFRFGLTNPFEIAPGSSVAGLARRFTDLSAVIAEDGRLLDLTHFPMHGRFEDAVQLVGAAGRVEADNLAERYCFVMEWDTAAFPSCLIWISNAGIHEPPWNDRHVALGIEPICSAFDLGNRASTQENPISRDGEPTSVQFRAERLWQTEYRFSVECI
jgi:hypothetical protein